MSFQSLIVHNGISHQKSRPSAPPSQSATEAQSDLKPVLPDSQTIKPKSNSTSKQQVLEETDTPLDLDTATLIPGFGESIFTLLIASPFLLLGFKKWLHR